MPAKRDPKTQPTYSIGVVSRVTGINPETLRVWERRYQMTVPVRSGARKSRFYSQQDVDRLSLVKSLVDAGHPVSSLARLSADELRRRIGVSSGRNPAAAKASATPCRVVVLGDALPARLAAQKTQLAGIEIVGAFRGATEFDKKAKALAPELLLLEYSTLQPETLAHVSRHLATAGARHAVVIFGFGAQTTVREFERAGVLCLQAPVNAPEIRRACAMARDLAADIGGEISTRTGAVPPRRFSANQLARIAARVPTVKCECPHHLVGLINSLVAFETYSSECENLNPEDREIHALLHATTASSRALLESGLAKLIEFEGLTVD